MGVPAEQFQRMMQKASRSLRLANVGNQDLITPQQAVAPAPQDKETLLRSVALGIRPTTDEANLNKTEARYLDWLRTQSDYWIGVQSITLKLGHDCRYTPDFWALDAQGLRAIDTKATRSDSGKPLVQEDAMIKIRIAARLFPFVRFVIAWREGEVWQHKEVKP